MKKLIEYDFTTGYKNTTNACTLPAEFVTQEHKSKWVITGEVCYDYYSWVNDFEAVHPKYGRVFGNFEKIVYATSKKGYEHFCKNHPAEEWNYWDI